MKPTAVADPRAVPSTQPNPSRTTATTASAGAHDGSTVAVAEPTASTPIETIPHSGSAPTRALAASVPGWRTPRAAKPAVNPTSSASRAPAAPGPPTDRAPGRVKWPGSRCPSPRRTRPARRRQRGPDRVGGEQRGGHAFESRACGNGPVVVNSLPGLYPVDMAEWPDLAAVEALVAVADHGSLAAAARATGMAQPNVSRSVARLERRFGLPLISRSTTGASLTPQGLLVVEWSRELLAAARPAHRRGRGTRRRARAP